MKTKLFLFFAALMMSFGMNAQINSIAVLGEAAGGWPGDPGNPGPVDVHQMTSTDGENWTLSGLVLTTFDVNGGGIKFRANNAWDINWGAAEFPAGTATQDGANIQCIAGTYDVTFNSTTGVYNFSGGTPIPTVKLVGPATGTVNGIAMNFVGSDTFRASNITLLDGAGQFSIDDFTVGETTFPTGTITGASDNIPVVAGIYSSVSINLSTGEYNFVLIQPITSIAVVGEAAGGWPGDLGNPGPEDVHQMTTTDGENWTLNGLSLTTFDANGGGIKFRANNAWDINWGAAEFPAGTGTQDGANIQCIADTYNVTFNSITGAYSFVLIPPFSVVYNSPNVFTSNVTISNLNPTTSGEPVTSYSISPALPSGLSFNTVTGVISGTPSVISATTTYIVTATNTAGSIGVGVDITVNAPANAQVNSVAVVGEAAGGWPGDEGNLGPEDVHQMTSTDGENWTLTGLVLTTFDAINGGGIKFRANNAWDINWGAAEFPAGTATQDGANIQCVIGTYDVTFNSITGAYNFTGGTTPLQSVAVVGEAAGGWPGDLGNPGPEDVHQMTSTDGENWTLSGLVLTTFDVNGGGIKFRANNAWDINWGAAEFPAGTGIQNGINIQCIAGTYDVTFNSTTGAYGFVLISPFSIVYNTPNVFTRNVTIANLNPTVSGAAVTSYSIAPALPGGLSFNTTTGVISGTPLAISATTTYTVTATNTGGSTSFGVVITVNDEAPSALSYNSPNLFTIGSAINDLIPTVLGVVLSYSISPSLPDGLAFDTATGIISGTPTTMSETASYTVTAANLGGSVSFEVVIAVEGLLNSNENQFKNISIYPNPFLDSINVNGLLSNGRYSMYSVDGKLIQEESIKGSVINVKQVPSGIYFLKLSDKGNTERIFKVIKR